MPEGGGHQVCIRIVMVALRPVIGSHVDPEHTTVHEFPEFIGLSEIVAVSRIPFVGELPGMDIRGISPPSLQVTPPGLLEPANLVNRPANTVKRLGVIEFIVIQKSAPVLHFLE